MRVAVCVDPMCGLSSREAGTAIARAFRAQGDECVVVPVGQAGLGAAEALADILDADPMLLPARSDAVGYSGTPGRSRDPGRADSPRRPEGAAPDGVSGQPDALVSLAVGVHDMVVGVSAPSLSHGSASDPFEGSSWPVGRAVAQALAHAPDPADGVPRRVFLDPGSVRWHDGGAGFLAGLGATTADAVDLCGGARGLDGLTRLDLDPVLERLHGVELVLLCDPATRDRHLCGLRGITSVVGHDHGHELADRLHVDHLLAGLADACDRTPLATRDGSGASGGLGFAVQVVGGRVSTGFDACRHLTGLDRALQLADLVVVGCDQLDFGHWDQFSVLPIAALVDTRVPVVAINRRTHVSQRELRTQGIESAHELADDPAQVPASDEITDRVRPIAASWRVG